MACLKLGLKNEAFRREGQSWICNSGLPSDVTIQVGEMAFHLHKFPLLSRSGLLERLANESTQLQLSQLPGGALCFEMVAKFCYGVKIELNSMNVVSLRCAAEFLEMNEEYSEGNLVAQTEDCLVHVLSNWTDTIKALETCEDVLPFAEDLQIVTRCINSLALIICSHWPEKGSVWWNGIRSSAGSRPVNDEWWYRDVSFLSFPLFKRLIDDIKAGGLKNENIAGGLVFYAEKYIPQMNSSSTISVPSEADQRKLLEDIAELLPVQRGVTNTRFLLRLLRAAMVLQASSYCREDLERKVGMQLDEASLEDLLFPNMGYYVETLYDIDCFQRILEHFMDQVSVAESPNMMEESNVMEETPSLTAITMVANLVDAYLADVSSDVNLKLPKFQSIAAAIPDYARASSDGIYRAIDVYLKAHSWLTDSERDQICRLLNCQKLSLEASTHAAQNSRLPLRMIVQVLYFEQLRLRISISSWLFVSDNLETSQNPNSVLTDSKNDEEQQRDDSCGRRSSLENMRERISELEKDCESIKEKFQKMVKSTRTWNILCRKKSNACNSKAYRQNEKQRLSSVKWH